MADGSQIDLERYHGLKRGGSSASQVYARAREDGLGKIDGIRIIRQLFSLSYDEAKAVVRDVNLPADRSPFRLPPVRSYKELEQVLRDELGFCGCAAAGEAIEVLRDVLRHARDCQRAFGDSAAFRRANDAMLDRLNFSRVPGLATWFLYLLDQRNVVEHAGRVSTCWIAPKGLQLLEAIEKWYPPPPEAAEDEPAEPSAAPDTGRPTG
jgi:hypothetical protein